MKSKLIDFRVLREVITPESVLQLLHRRIRRYGSGEPCTPCLVDVCRTERGREATFNRQVLFCHRCGGTWDAVAIWAWVNRQSSYEAALSLCKRFGIDVPYR